MAARKDYSDWLTKQQAADTLGVTTKTIERIADRKEIQQVTWKRPGKPAIAVFHPGDVQRLWKERNPDTPEGFVVPESAPERDTPPSRTGIVRRDGRSVEAFTDFLEAMRTPHASGISELRHKLFLTMKEASEYSGLPPVYLRKLIDDGKLKVVAVNAAGSKRIRRADLEAL